MLCWLYLPHKTHLPVSLAVALQAVLEILTVNVKVGSSVYEEGHTVLLSWCDSAGEMEQVRLAACWPPAELQLAAPRSAVLLSADMYRDARAVCLSLTLPVAPYLTGHSHAEAAVPGVPRIWGQDHCGADAGELGQQPRAMPRALLGRPTCASTAGEPACPPPAVSPSLPLPAARQA